MTTDSQRRTLSIEETAVELGIGRKLAYELAREGKLPGVLRLGRRLLVSRPALDRYLGGLPVETAALR